jgi:hypothetical protein
MYKYILESAGNINWMAVFALLTFFFIFVISAYAILVKSKAYVDKMAHMPLEDSYPLTTEIETGHER